MEAILQTQRLPPRLLASRRAILDYMDHTVLWLPRRPRVHRWLRRIDFSLRLGTSDCYYADSIARATLAHVCLRVIELPVKVRGQTWSPWWNLEKKAALFWDNWRLRTALYQNCIVFPCAGTIELCSNEHVGRCETLTADADDDYLHAFEVEAVTKYLQHYGSAQLTMKAGLQVLILVIGMHIPLQQTPAYLRGRYHPQVEPVFSCAPAFFQAQIDLTPRISATLFYGGSPPVLPRSVVLWYCNVFGGRGGAGMSADWV